MQSQTQQRLINITTYIFVIAISLLLVFGFVVLWNYVFSKEVNCFLFGTEKLPYTKGLGIYFIIDAIVGTLTISRFNINKIN